MRIECFLKTTYFKFLLNLIKFLINYFFIFIFNNYLNFIKFGFFWSQAIVELNSRITLISRWSALAEKSLISEG